MSSIAHLLHYASSIKASDVHLITNQPPILRQYGELVVVEDGNAPFTAEQILRVINEMLPQHLQDRFAHEGEADFSHQEPTAGRFRVNAFMESGKPSLSMRLVKDTVPTFEELGLPPTLGALALWHSGITLASGATGSGKSTSLARMIEHINEHQSRRIITIEDPIEFVFKPRRSFILQREIGIDTQSFQAALHTVLRQDPDVVMVGEMRDAQSFSAALSMAETGHLVLSTLHSDTAPQAVGRILNFFPPAERDIVRMSLAINLRAIFCQRLLADVNGRLIPAVEVMINTPMVQKLLQTNVLEKLSSAIQGERESGMIPLDEAILELIEAEKVTIEEGMANASNPESLRMRLSGINLDEGRRIL